MQGRNDNNVVRIALQSNDLGRPARVFNHREVVLLLRAAVEREGNQVAFARRHRLDRVYLNMILNGRRSVSDKVIKALGLREVYTATD